MQRTKRLYKRLPRPLQDLSISAATWRLRKRRFDREFDAVLNDYRDRDFWTREELVAYRDQRLRDIARFAAHNVPFYRQSAYRGLDEIESAVDLGAFPILSKEEVRLDPASFQPSPLSQSGFRASTSGTTGASLSFLQSQSAIRHQWAVWWRYRMWYGLERSTWSAVYGAQPVGDEKRVWRLDLGLRRLLLSTFHTAPTELDQAIHAVQRFRVPWLHGFPSALSQLAARALEVGVSLPTVRWVTTGAEQLTQPQRKLLRDAFGVEPREHYGAAEGVVNASECPHGSLHIDEDFSLVEACDGELVGTNLTNELFLLIRYRSGDTGEVAEEACTCARKSRLIRNLQGRSDDYLILPNGRRVSRLSSVLAEVPGIVAGQFVQSADGHVRLRIVLQDPETRSATVDSLERSLAMRLGNGFPLTVQVVQRIEPTAAGKIPLVRRERHP